MAAGHPRVSLRSLLWLGLASSAAAFYIPGWSITSYKDGEHVPLLVNKVYSDNTQLQYAYYDLPFVCPPTGRAKAAGGLLSGESIPLNLGEVLRGDRIKVSDIDLEMGKDNACQSLCRVQLTRDDVRRAEDLIRQGYVTEWIVDNMPGATSFVSADKTKKYYAAGFKLGYTEYSFHTKATHTYINNHHTIVLRYRKAPGKEGERGEKIIVGFEVYPKSIGSGNRRDDKGCPINLSQVDGGFELHTNQTVHKDGTVKDDVLTVPFTYSVYFREDDHVEWSHRWDLYFVNQEEGSRIHWLAIVNSLIICGLLTLVVLVIIARTVRTDIKGYHEAVTPEGQLKVKRRVKASPLPEKSSGLLQQEGEEDEELWDEEETLEDVRGWKRLHNDVFRPPPFGVILAPLVGSGVQLLVMTLGLIGLSAFGVLNPSFRGGFISVGIGLFVFAGLFSGYFSARTFKSFEGQNYRRNAFVTAVLFPGLCFSIFFIVNLFVWGQASSTAIPFGTLVAILLLWLCVQVPLVYAGSYYGYWKAAAWEHPTKPAAIARQVPQQIWYLQPVPSILLSGLVPFAVIFIELLYVFQSLWQDKSGYYYVFGFLAVVSVILIVTIAEVTIVTVYVQLCAENHQWWWQSFFIGGGSALWIYAYCIYYYLFNLHITGFASSLLFFTYSFIACCVYGLLTGTIGFLSAYAFVRRIYEAIKVD